MKFAEIPKDLFFSRPGDPRLGEISQTLTHSFLHSTNEAPDEAPDHATLLFGYPDDEGIAANGGRPGAAVAPNEIRRFLYRMTPPTKELSHCGFLDCGNLSFTTSTKDKLGSRHEFVREKVQKTVAKNHFFVSLGGGHDYGYADAAGFLLGCKSLAKDQPLFANPLVINFDAHLDVRPVENSVLHSGTGFRRLLEGFGGAFEFWEIGIQDQCNALAHKTWAKDHGAQIVTLAEIRKVGLLPALKKLLSHSGTKNKTAKAKNSRSKSKTHGSITRRPLFLSIDIDAFSSNEAPGCSQSWPTGLHVAEFLPVMNLLFEKFHVCGVGIYEVSPPLDESHRTSKLAALLAWNAHVLHHSGNMR